MSPDHLDASDIALREKFLSSGLKINKSEKDFCFLLKMLENTKNVFLPISESFIFEHKKPIYKIQSNLKGILTVEKVKEDFTSNDVKINLENIRKQNYKEKICSRQGQFKSGGLKKKLIFFRKLNKNSKRSKKSLNSNLSKTSLQNSKRDSSDFIPKTSFNNLKNFQIKKFNQSFQNSSSYVSRNSITSMTYIKGDKEFSEALSIGMGTIMESRNYKLPKMPFLAFMHFFGSKLD